MPELSQPTAAFSLKKVRLVQQLSVPDVEYGDASPKGSVDEGIRDLIDEINSASGFVTTSSCGGRVSVYLEGKKSAAHDETASQTEQLAGVGGKGGGGTWLFVSHDPVTQEDWVQTLEFTKQHVTDPSSGPTSSSQGNEKRLIHFKFEPMILHVLTSSLSHGQVLLNCAIQAGFRESGAVNLTSLSTNPTMPMVAIRSMGLCFESLIGHESQESGYRQCIVPPDYLHTLMKIANERFSENTKRIHRFRSGFRAALQPPPPRLNPAGQPWEDPARRRERMRAEGLQRKAAIDQARGDGEGTSKGAAE